RRPSPCLSAAIANCVLPPISVSVFDKEVGGGGEGFLRKTKSLLPHIARFHFYNRLILPNFDYDGIVWGDKDNAVLMNNLQLLQNKAAKTILNRPFHSSATNALEALE
ncbi:unnamed protein product, partial [Porites evermanni]